MESAAPLATSMPASTAVPRSRAPMTASGPPIATAISSATMLSSSVAGSRFITRPSTSCRSEIDVPKSPCATPASQMKNCSSSDLSRPYSARSRSMSAWLAPGGSIMEIGSPGATRITTKTTTATPNSVIAIVSRRIRNLRSSNILASTLSHDPENLRLFGHARRENERPAPSLDGSARLNGERGMTRQVTARRVTMSPRQAGVINAGSSAPDLCCTTFTLLACTIGCAYWISGMT